MLVTSSYGTSIKRRNIHSHVCIFHKVLKTRKRNKKKTKNRREIETAHNHVKNINAEKNLIKIALYREYKWLVVNVMSNYKIVCYLDTLCQLLIKLNVCIFRRNVFIIFLFLFISRLCSCTVEFPFIYQQKRY